MPPFRHGESGFSHSTANVTQTDDPTAAAALMGAYYPRISVCPLTTLTANGCPP